MSDSPVHEPSVECACAAATDQSGRRSALGVILAGAGAMLAGGIGLAAGFLSNALGRNREHPWIRLGSVNDANILNVETFKRHILQVEHVHAWQTKRMPMDVYIKDLYPEDPLALLSTCSHLGCAVQWDAEESRFECPCHGGRYDETGQVLSGPPPRPLTRLDVKIEDDQCYVRLPGPRDGAVTAS